MPICISWDTAECKTSQPFVIYRSTKRFKRWALPWMRSCGRLEGQGNLRWGSWISSWFSWRGLFLTRTSYSSSRCCSPISNTRAVSLACPNWGIDVWVRIGTEVEFHLTERTAGRTENPEKTEHLRTDALSGILKDLIHTSRVMSTWVGVESCLPTLTLWATTMQASSDMNTETTAVWRCARVYHNRSLCRTFINTSLSFWLTQLPDTQASLAYIQLAQTTSNCMHHSARTLSVSLQ